jgi:transcription initiation factor TFIIIB Brf1 subunit/transcription initiation factor TFIIB
MTDISINIDDFVNNLYDNLKKDTKLEEQNTDVLKTEKEFDKPINEEDGTTLDYCLECKSNNIIEKYGYYICQTCGIQFNNIIDASQEWRYYGSNDNKNSDPARCGMPVNDLLPNVGIGSIICSNNKESIQMRRIRQIHSWNSAGYTDTTFTKNSKDMEILASNGGIKNCIIEEAKHMYKKVSYHKYKKKAKKEALQAACIQCACKLKDVPRDSDEMARMFGISKKDMRRGAKQFEEIWSIINENNQQSLYTDLKPSNSINFLERRCSELKLSNEIAALCKEVCKYIEDEDYLITHIPLSRTAGCIYFTCEYLKIPIDKNQITDICSISEVTINKCYQKLMKIKDDIIENTSLKNY